jgi:hypothetical protein
VLAIEYALILEYIFGSDTKTFVLSVYKEKIMRERVKWALHDNTAIRAVFCSFLMLLEHRT